MSDAQRSEIYRSIEAREGDFVTGRTLLVKKLGQYVTHAIVSQIMHDICIFMYF
jgi:hypothetical protein